MKFSHEEFVTDALKVIENTDPATYGAMLASDWDLRLADKLEDLPLDGMDSVERREAVDGFPTSYGMTGSIRSSMYGTSYLNTGTLTTDAERYGMSVAEFTAATIVHEFSHYHGHVTNTDPSEAAAFHAMSRFACHPGISVTVCHFAQNSEYSYLVDSMLGIPY